MYDGIIFDMDGTLWDSRAAIVESWNRAFEKHNVPNRITLEKLTGLMGLPMDLFTDSIFPGQKYEDVKPIFDTCYEYENDYLRKNGGILYPDLEKTLQILSNKYKLFIVSNCQAGYIEAFLEYHKLSQYFKDIECFGNNNLQKGDNIALIIKRNNLKAPVYVGDIDKDRQAAEYAGADFIYAEYGFGDVKVYDGIIHKFSDLQNI